MKKKFIIKNEEDKTKAIKELEELKIFNSKAIEYISERENRLRERALALKGKVDEEYYDNLLVLVRDIIQHFHNSEKKKFKNTTNYINTEFIKGIKESELNKEYSIDFDTDIHIEIDLLDNEFDYFIENEIEDTTDLFDFDGIILDYIEDNNLDNHTYLEF